MRGWGRRGDGTENGDYSLVPTVPVGTYLRLSMSHGGPSEREPLGILVQKGKGQAFPVGDNLHETVGARQVSVCSCVPGAEGVGEGLIYATQGAYPAEAQGWEQVTAALGVVLVRRARSINGWSRGRVPGRPSRIMSAR